MDIFIISQDISHRLQQENTEICEQNINNIQTETMKGFFRWVLLIILYFNYSSIQCSNIQIAPIKQLADHHNTIIEDSTSLVIRKIKQSPNSQAQNDSSTKKMKNQLTKQVMELIYKQNQMKIRTQSLNQVHKYLVTNQFKGIGLYHSVPSHFVEGEVYRFFGIVLNKSLLTTRGQARYNFVNIVFSDLSTIFQFRCIKKITESLQFDISCRMEKQGIFFLSIFAGMQGQYSAKLRNIRSYATLFETLEYNVVAPQPNNALLQMRNNSLYVIWDSIASLTNITIYQQKGNKKEYLLSNFHQKYEIPFADFMNFKSRQKTLLQLSHAQSLDGSVALKSTKYSQVLIQIQFYPQNHFSDEKIEGVVQWQTQLPWEMPIGSKFILNVTFKQNVKNQVFITYPDLSIKTLYFIKPLINMPITAIKANSWVQLQLIFRLPGLHVIQINSVTGFAMINRPIYVGHTYPLIPDYIDLQSIAYNPIKNTSLIDIYGAYYQKTTAILAIKQPSFNSSIEQKFIYVLQLLNGLRNKYNVDAVELDEQLSQIAQSHANSIRNTSYFSHINSNGEGPKQRAIKMGFKGSIGENIAKANYLTEAHLALQRSASHLVNSINEIWSRVGLGIAFTQDNQYIVIYQFSTRDFKKYPLSIKQKQKIQTDFMSLLRQQNPNIMKQDKQLSSGIQSWMQSDRSIELYKYLIEKFNRGSKYIERPMIGASYTISYTKNWDVLLKNSNYLSGFREFSQVGIGIDCSQGSTNKVEIYIIFV